MAKATRMHSMPPIDTPISQNDAPSRRHFLTQAAGVAAGGTVLALATVSPGQVLASPAGAAAAPNTILTLIADHRAATAASAAAMNHYSRNGGVDSGGSAPRRPALRGGDRSGN
ncbi:hypothetical protein SAMN05443248_1632 [Bradyrhizobium erythrophlei]|uniref:Tat (Twin-arginine translocation) pathway signal sequence n=1 Tax=Bradyrhizobium erythrophlei TaxID=1437360 RepID=A0A1M5K0L6_9BRAD|nr:hypothetical protein SAMN05443248_1632 [Bradyrhizobium erythrophlei]